MGPHLKLFRADPHRRIAPVAFRRAYFHGRPGVRHERAAREQEVVSGLRRGPQRGSAKLQAGPEKWSIAEVAEHIALSESSIFQAAEGAMKPSAREKMADPGKIDEKILTAIPNRKIKAAAPEPLRPHHQFKTTAEAIDFFKSARDQHIKYLSETQDALREHFFNNPVLGDIDAFQWVLFVSAQTERHVAQINEVKASVGFPQQ